jgi:hypothetical protein
MEWAGDKNTKCTLYLTQYIQSIIIEILTKEILNMINNSDLPSPIPPTHNGFFYSKLSGDYPDMGYQHGSTYFYMINKIISRMKDYTYWSTGLTWEFLKNHIWDLWWNNIPSNYQQEMKGISDGVRSQKVDSIDEKDIFLWNSFMEVFYYYYPTYKDQLSGISGNKGNANPPNSCSAFIVVGKDYTSDGKIVMAHNSFTGYEMAYMNLLLDITTKNKDRFVMQTMPGLITSNTDFGVNNKGLMITETTIGGFSNYCSENIDKLLPEFVRARMAMELSSDFNEFKKLMLVKNTGGYANSWLVGDYNKNQIMRFELGFKYYTKPDEITDNGYFAGFNAPIDPRIRNLECSNTGYMDIRRHQGARQVTIPKLIEQNKGQITSKIAQDILSNHIDPYHSQIQNKEVTHICARNVDAHYELDAREYMSQIGRPLPFQPQGAADGKTSDSELAKQLNFNVKWGSSSDIGFNAKEFFEKHPQFNDMKPFIESRKSYPWTSVNEVANNIQSKTKETLKV